jgi:hypothetical protein
MPLSMVVERLGRLGVILACTMMLAFLSAFAEHRLNDFEAVLPQIAAGASGNISVETTLTLVNPWEEAITVELTATDPLLVSSGMLVLAPLERREILVQGEELRAGAVRVRAPKTVSTTAVVKTRENGSTTSIATIAGTKPSSAIVFPVFSKFGGVGSTGIALFFQQVGLYRFKLYDSTGVEIATKNILLDSGKLPVHMSRFVEEFFDIDLPDGFAGWVHGYGLDSQARGLASGILHMSGATLWSGQVSSIDATAAYKVSLVDEGDESVVNDLSDQYGFLVVRKTRGGWLVTCIDQIAAAVERDARVSSVEPRIEGPFVWIG